MPSIFVWRDDSHDSHDSHNSVYDSSHGDSKRNTISIGSNNITYYSGSNWFMEEHPMTSSFMYTNQKVETVNGKKVLIYQAVQMPTNWVGSDCLEIVQIPYKLHKKNEHGQLDQLGQWMRFISKNTFASVQEFEQLKQIKQWMSKNHN